MSDPPPPPPPETSDPPPPPPAPAKKAMEIRSVYSSNLDSEFALIRHVIDRFPFAAMDTEFPGVAFCPLSTDKNRSPFSLYSILKTNVDALNLIQIGLTLSDSLGNSLVFEFNFRDFDISSDFHDAQAIELLKKQGINFELNKHFGIELTQFASLLMTSGLVLADVSWVTFHSAYDFGYLIKALTGHRLPETLPKFLALVKVFFGENVFDLKYMMRFCEGLYGGLDKVAKTVGVERVVGKSHQAGSDSLLTWHAFEKIRADYFGQGGVARFAGVLYGLEVN